MPSHTSVPTSKNDSGCNVDAYCSTGSSPTHDAAVESGVCRLTVDIDGQPVRVRVAYELVGPSDAPVIAALGGISAHRHVCRLDETDQRGWWEAVSGPNKPLDTNCYRVLGFDWLGGPDETRFEDEGSTPLVTTHTQAALLASLLDHLSVPVLHTLIGASYGGMVGLAFAACYADRLHHLVLIGAAHRSHAMATALRGVQRKIVRLADATGNPQEGIALARGLAMTTYRSAREFNRRFALEALAGQDIVLFPVDAYLAQRGDAFSLRFDADSYLRLSESIDLHRVDPALVTTPTTVIAFDTDAVVPPWLAHELTNTLAGPHVLHELRSEYGHDAFLKEAEVLGEVLRAQLGTASALPSATTRSVRAAIGSDREHGAVVPPLHLSATYTFPQFGVAGRYDYTRSGNPTRDHLADAIADLEGGAGAVVTGSGMAAVTTVLHLLGEDDLLLAPHDCYGGTRRLIDSLAAKGRFRARFVNQSDPDELREAVWSDRPRMIWVETPSNPLLRITDLKLASELATSAGAILVADNTFMSPALQRPIGHGADLVVHSTTKYLNGHSDIVGGAIVARDLETANELTWWANCLGVTGAPFDSYLTLRGLRTLHARIEVHERNARAIATTLAQHPAVAAAHHPSLPHHPGRDVAERQQSGYGAIVSFQLHDGREGVRRFLDGLRHFSLAESLGGVESLVAHPATMTHASMTEDARRIAGITDGLLRLSVGIEDIGDLTRDIEAGLRRAAGVA
jgi:cystathionine gamma-synthase